MVTGEGMYCDCCGVCADRGCVKAADRKIRCKAIASDDKGLMKHHWVKGKISVVHQCYVNLLLSTVTWLGLQSDIAASN
jgi:diacylglycerol kinase (ATP)